MIKIIKNGDTHKRIECESCGCIFEFCGLDTEDDVVECPECGFSQDTEDDIVECPEFGLSQDTSDAENSYSIEKVIENILKEEHKDTDEYVKLQEERIKLRGRRSKVSEKTCREESKSRGKSCGEGCESEEIK